MERITHGSVFSGMGGFDLAADWCGIKNLFNCELNPFLRDIVLGNHWPEAKRFENVETADFNIYRNAINILSGGFPCQDNSDANQTLSRKTGLQGERTGLFFSMCRAIDTIRPDFVVAENVAGILSVNSGRDFKTILSELARMGYDAEWRMCRSAEAGAIHVRKRLYIVAYRNGLGLQKGQSFFAYVPATTKQEAWEFAGTSIQTLRGGAWTNEPPVPCMVNGFPSAIHGYSERQVYREQIQAYGNAVSPQIATAIFRRIIEILQPIKANIKPF